MLIKINMKRKCSFVSIPEKQSINIEKTFKLKQKDEYSDFLLVYKTV